MEIFKIKIPRNVFYGFLLFFFLAFLFSYFRLQIYTINAWCFAMTGEIQQIQFTTSGELKMEDTDATPVPSAAAKPVFKTTSAPKIAVDSGKPVKVNLPPTVEPEILFTNNLTGQELNDGPLFPSLRLFNGKEWKKEKTEIRMASDGEKLEVSIFCFDSEPSKLVTQYSEKEGANFAWKDDSIEFFLIRNPKADHYFQYVCSASGISKVYYYKTSENYSMGTNETEFPANFKKPVMRGEKTAGGFKIYMSIDLSNNLGLPKLSPGKQIYLQIVRNYRGQQSGDPLMATLQLFPTFIYADSRSGAANNHDRRAFQPAKLVEE
jgi:hypothetical protein